ncbi:MAG: LysE family transporter [Boseongicola sp.]|nr:LysE family transporter [Boseongicola sp.]NNL17498.1 LysE family transporter [Boseongicola sp.]
MEPTALLAILIPIAVIQIVGWATPGPNHLTIITASVTSGRAAGIRAATGIAAGALTWSLIAISGIAIIFEVFPPLYVALRVIGAGYLIYLGSNAFRAARRGGVFKLTPGEASPATTAPFRTAYLVMMTNPKAVLFFGSILTAFIPPEGSQFLMLIIVLQIGFLAAVLNIFAALFFSVGPVKRAFENYSYVISIVFGVLFCGLGALVAWDVIQGFLN